MPDLAETQTNRYDYDRPTEKRALEALARLVGEEEADEVWRAACRRVGVVPVASGLTLDELIAVADELKRLDGLPSIAGNSLSVRLRSYRGVSR